jgi:hypothetical protein
MSSLYNVGVLNLEGSKIKLSVEVIHPDSNYISDSPGFALMLLHHDATLSTPLGGEADFDLLLNESWIQENARGFIRSVAYEPRRKKRNGYLTGTLDIEVTHPAWISHLKDTDSWDSAAFDPAAAYDECPPKAPATDDDTTPAPATQLREGFIPVWKYIFAPYLMHSPKDIFWMPAYSQSCYKPDPANAVTDLSDESLRAHEGRLFTTGKEYGILYRRETDWGLFQIGNGSCGSTYIDGKELIPLVLNTRKKLSYPMDPGRMLNWSHPVIFDASVEGDTIRFRVMVMEEDEQVFLFSRISALEFLMKPFETWRGNEFEENTPLGDFLNAEMKAKKIARTWDIYMRHKDIAELVITNFGVEKSLDIPFPDLSGLSNEEVISYYTFDKWPQYTITIEVTDPALLEGYDKKLPFEHIFGRLGDHLVK